MEDLSKLTKKQLLERLQQQEPVQQIHSGAVTYNDHESEMEKLNRMANATNPHQLPFSEKNDHKNIMLYTALNKRVGRLHPENARRTMDRWKRAGVQLYTTPRTDQQIESFKQTEEYKIYHAKHIAERKLRKAQSGKGKTENMIKEIAATTASIVAGSK